MPIAITCAGCGNQWSVPDASLGKVVVCPRCQARLMPATRQGMENYATRVLFGAPAAPEEIHMPEVRGPEIPFICPFCDESYRVSKKLRGRKINCRNCREPSRV